MCQWTATCSVSGTSNQHALMGENKGAPVVPSPPAPCSHPVAFLSHVPPLSREVGFSLQSLPEVRPLLTSPAASTPAGPRPAPRHRRGDLTAPPRPLPLLPASLPLLLRAAARPCCCFHKRRNSHLWVPSAWTVLRADVDVAQSRPSFRPGHMSPAGLQPALLGAPYFLTDSILPLPVGLWAVCSPQHAQSATAGVHV